MHHSLKIKILDLDHIESIVEDITAVEAKQIIGGGLSITASQVVPEQIVGGGLSITASQVVPEQIVEASSSGSFKSSLGASLNDKYSKKGGINGSITSDLPPMLDPLCLSL